MPVKIHKHICCHCDTVFYSRSPRSKLCSKKCANAYFRQKETPSQTDLERLYQLQQEQEAV